MIQIKEIVLYNYRNQKRVIPFKLGTVNIITGKSKKGKSTLIEIIDYCLGSSKCDVSEGVVREKVAWFGLLLNIGKSQVFVARENPPHDAYTTNRAFYLEGKKINSPEKIESPNTTIEAIEDTLARKMGINENLNVPPEGQTRRPLAAGIRQSIFYCFQDQDLIASKTMLLHKQSESFMPQQIKDSFPYFLGAVREDHLLNVQEISKLKRQLSLALQEYSESEAVVNNTASRAYSLLKEAKDLSMISGDSNPESLDEAYGLLKKVGSWSPEKIPETPAGSDDYLQIQNEMFEIENDIGLVDEKIQTAKMFSQGASGFQGEAQEQLTRLKSIGLYPKNHRDSCLVCKSETKKTSQLQDAIDNSIETLQGELETVTRELPRISGYLEKLNEQKQTMTAQYRKKASELNILIQRQSQLKNIRDKNIRIGMVIGKISLWLDSVKIVTADPYLKKKIEGLRSKISDLEKLVDPQDVEDRINSILLRISGAMTIAAKELGLEHSGNPVRFDRRDLTVVVELKDKSVPLKRIGSGENHVGYHLVAMTALHEHFIANNRPVPRFLVLDQPSQIYYPVDKREDDGSLKNIEDDDREDLAKLYKFLFDFTKSQKGKFQLILLDHAKPDDEEFLSYIAEEWRGDKALVPITWL